jgi:hypothetical protein
MADVLELRPSRTLAGVFLSRLMAALVVAWCLAAIVTASVRRFEGACTYFVAAGVVVGFANITAIVLAP